MWSVAVRGQVPDQAKPSDPTSNLYPSLIVDVRTERIVYREVAGEREALTCRSSRRSVADDIIVQSAGAEDGRSRIEH